jgi:hypothetical protein
MPFKSEKQRKYMFANHPEIAKRWTKESPTRKKVTRKHEVDAMGRLLKKMDKK